MPSKSKREWIFLKFNDNYADEFDCRGFVVTTKSKWEKAKKRLKKEFKGSFDASFGTNESNCYDVNSYISCFTEHKISLKTARELASIVGRSKPVSTFKGKKRETLQWFFVIEHGTWPKAGNLLINLGFSMPPERCASHNNVIGECDEGKPKEAWVPSCKKEKIDIVNKPEMAFFALFPGGMNEDKK